MALKSFNAPVRERLAALNAAPQATLATLTTLLSATTSCCSKIAALFPNTERKILSSLTHPLVNPFETFIDDYGLSLIHI